MISEEIKTDIFSSLFDIVEDTENHKKIKNVIDNLSNPLILKLKYSMYLIVLLLFIIIVLLLFILHLQITHSLKLKSLS